MAFNILGTKSMQSLSNQSQFSHNSRTDQSQSSHEHLTDSLADPFDGFTIIISKPPPKKEKLTTPLNFN
jgi:hypothetical protein